MSGERTDDSGEHRQSDDENAFEQLLGEAARDEAATADAPNGAVEGAAEAASDDGAPAEGGDESVEGGDESVEGSADAAARKQGRKARTRKSRGERKAARAQAKRERAQTAEDPEQQQSRPKGWAGGRLVALIAAVAVVSLLIGVGVMQFIVSPAEIAARTEAPEPGPVTTAVEERTIENTIITRGEVTYADAVEVEIDAGGTEDRPIVTGHVPKVGDELDRGDIALEIAGRPVIVLPGDLPAYRTLSFGMRGPDVRQLKKALKRMGFNAGDTSNDEFEGATAEAIGALYNQVGYTPSDGGREAAEMLRDAERAVRDAGVGVAQAQADLEAARKDEASNLIGEEAAHTSANEALGDAQEALGLAQQEVLPKLPSSEVLFLEDLPRRVDDVSISRGASLEGSPMQVSGAKLTIIGTVSKQDAELLEEGATAYFPGPEDEEITATVRSISAPKSGSGGSGGSGGEDPDGGEGEDGGGQQSASRYTVELTPKKLTSAQIEALRGSNVRLRIPIASTDGKVLAVPIAALSAGAGGEDRVELLVDLKSGPDAETENVVVETGLAADGYVEITSKDPRIEAGARVVVGR